MPNDDLISRAAPGISRCNPDVFNNRAYGEGWNACIAMIEAAPTVDAVPVRHGRWIVDEDPHDGDVRCSRCFVCIDALNERHWPTLKVLGYTLSSFYPYCPHCGAKMDGGEDIDVGGKASAD